MKKIPKDLEKRLAELLTIVDPERVVRFDKITGKVFIGGKHIDQARLANLRAEADFFVTSDLWHIITETTKEIAQETMFVKSESLVDLQKGKTILFTIDSQKKIVDLFKTKKVA